MNDDMLLDVYLPGFSGFSAPGWEFEMVGNTAPTCVTGHPAISVPVGKTLDGRPIGAMLIARHLDEITLYRAAAALEACYRSEK